MEGDMTPVSNRAISRLRRQNYDTPVKIPESPQMTVLGFGTGVKVYSYARSPRVGIARSPWAVKKVSKHTVNSEEFQTRLSSEANILRKLNHPNIVGFRAYVTGSDGRICLAMEECELSLNDLIEHRSEKCYGPFPPKDTLTVALDIAKALSYLHNEAHIMHGDVKSHNILVKGNFQTAKLCDFGVYIPVDISGRMDEVTAGPEGGYIGTECWKAPELVDEDSCLVSTKADMFAYGLTLWEMLALSAPHMGDVDKEISTEMEEISFNEESFLSKIGTRPSLPTYPLDDKYEPVIHIFNWCTERDVNARASAKQILDFLDQL